MIRCAAFTLMVACIGFSSFSSSYAKPMHKDIDRKKMEKRISQAMLLRMSEEMNLSDEVLLKISKILKKEREKRSALYEKVKEARYSAELYYAKLMCCG